jgi:hypothetical protein
VKLQELEWWLIEIGLDHELNKEPNTSIFIDGLKQKFKQMWFIHVGVPAAMTTTIHLLAHQI